ncbi:MAG: hypothetical protein A2W25_15285 [candidate division Zixibacteria bacterium RBG_16_53_22]|nr:MAG: hypothetical protein A2W25_15285 [candidate division Zixibacteria bacterium RBG_16_53_22]
MDTATFNAVLISLLATCFALLMILLGWIGARLHAKLDETIRILRAIERDLRGDLAKIDRRVTRIEDHPALAIPPLLREAPQ